MSRRKKGWLTFIEREAELDRNIACGWAFDLGMSDTVLFQHDGHRLVGAVNAGFVRQHNATLAQCIAIVRRRHSNDWSANETLAELEKLKETTQPPRPATNGTEPDPR